MKKTRLKRKSIKKPQKQPFADVIRNSFSKNFAILTGKHLESFFNKVAINFIKKRLNTGVFL